MGQLNFKQIQYTGAMSSSSQKIDRVVLKVASEARGSGMKVFRTNKYDQLHLLRNTSNTTHQTLANSTALFSQFESSNYEKGEEDGECTNIDKATLNTEELVDGINNVTSNRRRVINNLNSE